MKISRLFLLNIFLYFPSQGALEGILRNSKGELLSGCTVTLAALGKNAISTNGRFVLDPSVGLGNPTHGSSFGIEGGNHGLYVNLEVAQKVELEIRGANGKHVVHRWGKIYLQDDIVFPLGS